MSRPFKSYSGRAAFAEVNEPMNSGDYTLNKKSKAAFCAPNICHPNRNINSQSNLLMLRNANTLKFNSFVSNFDKTSLYVNLYTTLNLENLCPISDLSGNCQIPITTTPLYINSVMPPYEKYIIDPSGDLFGNSPCGENNFTNLMQYTIKENPYKISGSYIISNDSNYNNIIIFTGNGKIQFLNPTLTINYIIVGGGGGGGGATGAAPNARGAGGGGGGGGQVLTSNFISSNKLFEIIVGHGGLGGESSNAGQTPTVGSNGGISLISTIGSALGGYGGFPSTLLPSDKGGNGGQSGSSAAGGTGGLANNNGANGTNGSGGGGGGTGTTLTTTTAGNGATSSTSVYKYGTAFGAGGGAGAGDCDNGAVGNTAGSGGNSNAGNGGWSGSVPNHVNGYDAKPNYGGGGGGGVGGDGTSYYSSGSGGNGGSGVVILYFNS